MKANGAYDLCDLCSLSCKYFSYFEIERTRVDYIIKQHISMVKDFKKYKDVEIFTGDYTENSRHPFNGSKDEASLYEYIYNEKYFDYNSFI